MFRLAKTVIVVLALLVLANAQKNSISLVANTGHAGNILGIAYSPTGEFYATADEIELKVWEAATSREIRSFPLNKEAGSISFSLDGALIAAEGKAGVTIWEIRSGKSLRVLEGFTDPTFTARGNYLAAVDYEGVKLFDAKTLVGKISLTPADESSINAIKVSADEKLLASVHNNSVKIWNLEQRSETSVKIKHPQGEITAIALSPDAKILASCGSDSTVRLWDSATAVELHRLRIPEEGNCSSIAFSRDGKSVATAGDRGVHLWNVAEGVLEGERETGESKWTGAVDFSPDGKTLVGGMIGGQIRVWEHPGGKLLLHFNPELTDVDALAFAPKERQLASDLYGITLWNFGDVDADTKVLSERGDLMVYISQGQMLAVKSSRGVVLIDPVAGKSVTSPIAEKLRDTLSLTWGATAVSPNGKLVANASASFEPGPITLYDAATASKVRSIEGFDKSETAEIVFSPDSALLASCGGNNVKVADVGTGKTLYMLEAAAKSYQKVRHVAFSPKGDLLAAGGLGKEVRIWKVADGSPLATTKVEEYIESITFSPDGKTVVTGLENGTMVFVNVSDGVAKKSIAAHAGELQALAFHPSGKLLASGAEDGRIKLWDVTSGKLLGELIIVKRKAWIVTSADNRFEASEWADEYLHWVEGTKSLPLETHAAKYRTAGLLEKLLAPYK